MIQLVAIAVGLVGCVMPPDAEYVQTPVDLAPRIESPGPAPYLGVVEQALACDRLYSANITDPDLNDTLYWRWFLDWHRHPAQTSEITVVVRDAQTQTVTVSFKVPGNDERFDALTTEPHIVELLVADRPFLPEPHQDPTPGKVTSMTWTVQWFTQTPPATQCD